MVERNLAKVEVASSRLVSRSKFLISPNDVVKRQPKGLRLRRQPVLRAFCFRIANPAIR